MTNSAFNLTFYRYKSIYFDHSMSYDVVVQRKITAAHQKIFLNRKVATINYMYEKETNIEAVCKLKIQTSLKLVTALIYYH